MDRKWRALIIVCVAIFMLLLDITVVNVALPDIQKELHTSFTDLQWVVDAYALMLATVVLIAGSLGDLLGRKRVFISGVVLFTGASALCGAAQSPLMLNLSRGVQGIGGGIMFAVSLAILSQEFHGKERGTAFGIWGATVGLAVAIGPLVGGALTTWAGWRWIFFVNVPIGIACIAGAIRELHESRDEEHGGYDIPGFVTLSLGLFAFVLAMLRGNDWHWGSARVVGLFVAAGVLMVAFVLVEWRQENPMLDLTLFRVPTFTGAQITAFVISAAMFSQFLYLTLYLQNVLGLSPIAGRRPLPAAVADLVRRRADRGTAVRADPGEVPARRRARGGRRGAAAHVRDHAELGLDDAAGGLRRRRHRHRARERAARLDRRQRRAAAAGRDGVGDQQHLPAGRHRDGDRGARRASCRRRCTRSSPEPSPRRSRRRRRADSSARERRRPM